MINGLGNYIDIFTQNKSLDLASRTQLMTILNAINRNISELQKDINQIKTILNMGE